MQLSQTAALTCGTVHRLQVMLSVKDPKVYASKTLVAHTFRSDSKLR